MKRLLEKKRELRYEHACRLYTGRSNFQKEQNNWIPNYLGSYTDCERPRDTVYLSIDQWFIKKISFATTLHSLHSPCVLVHWIVNILKRQYQ